MCVFISFAHLYLLHSLTLPLSFSLVSLFLPCGNGGRELRASPSNQPIYTYHTRVLNLFTLWKRWARITRISIWAKFLPIQSRGGYLKKVKKFKFSIVRVLRFQVSAVDTVKFFISQCGETHISRYTLNTMNDVHFDVREGAEARRRRVVRRPPLVVPHLQCRGVFGRVKGV